MCTLFCLKNDGEPAARAKMSLGVGHTADPNENRTGDPNGQKAKKARIRLGRPVEVALTRLY